MVEAESSSRMLRLASSLRQPSLVELVGCSHPALAWLLLERVIYNRTTEVAA